MASRVEGFDEAILYHAKNEFLEKGFNEASVPVPSIQGTRIRKVCSVIW